MSSHDQRQPYDVVFVGGGFSAGMTLLYLLQSLTIHSNESSRTVNIAVFDNADRFPKGIAYNEDEDSGAFLITPASEMMPPRPGGGNALTEWLTDNLHTWSARLQTSKNSLVQAWRPRLVEAVSRGEFEKVFLPRSVIGWFAEHLVSEAIHKAGQSGCASVDVRKENILRVERKPAQAGFHLTTRAGCPVSADHVVVAVGSGNFGSIVASDHDFGRYITAPLQNGICGLRSRLQPYFRKATTEEGPKTLIIGSNASSLDVVSVLIEQHAATGAKPRLLSASPTGKFPPDFRTFCDECRPVEPCASLAGLLEGKEPVTASELFCCAEADRQVLLGEGRHIGEVKALIYSQLLPAINLLDPDEKRAFVEIYGNRLSRQFYMTSPIYATTYQRAIAAGYLSLVAGKVTSLSAQEDCVRVEFLKCGSSSSDVFDLVVDCTGFEFPLSESTSPLIQSLFRDLGAKENRSQRGFLTSQDTFEVASNVSVVGPLYSGNVDRTGVCRWHLETTRGIAETAEMCGSDIAEKLLVAGGSKCGAGPQQTFPETFSGRSTA